MKLTARPWCLDFTVHSFHDLFDRPFFLPFSITRIRRLRSFIHDRYPRKLFTKDETKEEKIGRSCLEIYILKEKKCFLKDGDSKISMIRIVQGSRRKEWKTSLYHLFFSSTRKTFNQHANKSGEEQKGEPRERGWVRKKRGLKNERERRRNRALIASALMSPSTLSISPRDNSVPPFIVERSHVSGWRVIRAASRFFF